MENSSIINFTLIYNKHKDPLFNYVLKIVKSRMFAEDIVHDVFINPYKQQAFWFPWKPAKPGTFNYFIYLDPENRLNESNRENNTVKGTITVN